MAGCTQTGNDLLGNLEGAHRVHGWPEPLRVVDNVTIAPHRLVRMATLTAIGQPRPYVHDAVSESLAHLGFWELRDPVSEILAAAKVELSAIHTGSHFLDVGAQV